MSESEPEIVVFFNDRQSEVTDHQLEHTEQNGLRDGDVSDAADRKSTPLSSADSDDESIHLTRQRRQKQHRLSRGTSRSQSTLEDAVYDMLKMQNQMTQALSKVSDFLVNSLNTKQQANNSAANRLDNGEIRDRDFHAIGTRSPRRNIRYNRGDDLDSEYEESCRPGSRQRAPQRYHGNVKLPAFTGKDDWNVWINRFEAVAERQHWSEEEKLDNLLPKLEGTAAEFVFTQLRRHILQDYDELVSEINSRFMVIVTIKAFAAKFSKRDQKQHETAEEYAAELKCLYDKAYRSRDRRTRKEDLLRRFFDGLRNKEISWDVEFVKEPENIDEAVYHVVNWIQSRNRHSFQSSEKRGGNVRRVERCAKCESEDSDSPIRKVASKERQRKNNSPERSATDETAENMRSAHTGSNAQTDVDNKIWLQILEKITELAQSSSLHGERQSHRQNKKKTLICYACNQENHYARDCPFKTQLPNQIQCDERTFVKQSDLNTKQQSLNFQGPA